MSSPLIGSRQRLLLNTLAQLHLQETAPQSSRALACLCADKDWEIKQNTEAIDRLTIKGLMRYDPAHPEAFPRSKGAVLLTEKGVNSAEGLTNEQRIMLYQYILS